MRRYRILAVLILVIAGIPSCAPERKVNCDMVNLQRQEGLSVAQMAAGFQVSEADINKCAVANVPSAAESESMQATPEAASPGAGAGSSGESGGSGSGSSSYP